MQIIKQYNQIRETINKLRPKNPPEIIAVSKKQPLEKIIEAHKSGIQKFGENYIQEAIEKFRELPSVELHHIGPLQKNNIKKLFPLFSYTHGICSESVLIELNKQAEKRKHLIRFFLQANLTEETSKSGLKRVELIHLLKNISIYQNDYTKFIGLMTMGPSDENPLITRKTFRELYNIRNDYTDNAKLSMGMSGDYQIAIEEGSDYVRIGSLIFGERLK